MRVIRAALEWGLTLGTVGFLAGFIGFPLLIWLLGGDPNIAPLWGFILGPLGVLAGLPIGAVKGWRSPPSER